MRHGKAHELGSTRVMPGKNNSYSVSGEDAPAEGGQVQSDIQDKLDSLLDNLQNRIDQIPDDHVWQIPHTPIEDEHAPLTVTEEVQVTTAEDQTVFKDNVEAEGEIHSELSAQVTVHDIVSSESDKDIAATEIQADVRSLDYMMVDSEIRIPDKDRDEEACDQDTTAKPDQMSTSFLAQLKGLLDDQRRQLEHYIDDSIKKVRQNLSTEIKSIRFEVNLLKANTVSFFMRVAPAVTFTESKLQEIRQTQNDILLNQNIAFSNMEMIHNAQKKLMNEHRIITESRMDACTQILDDHMLEVKNHVTKGINFLVERLTTAQNSLTATTSEEVRKEEKAMIKANTENTVWSTNVIRGSMGLEQLSYKNIETAPILEDQSGVPYAEQSITENAHGADVASVISSPVVPTPRDLPSSFQSPCQRCCIVSYKHHIRSSASHLQALQPSHNILSASNPITRDSDPVNGYPITAQPTYTNSFLTMNRFFLLYWNMGSIFLNLRITNLMITPAGKTRLNFLHGKDHCTGR
ncbi:hypothetical protein KSP40_PGU002257 [Platanthera guangdongensis]|uniref:Uncharacterized protein n=1 Tax=Platanthera guangdongensis TaxID=2320717 RepID=A0ABR2M5B5_9ASPA